MRGKKMHLEGSLYVIVGFGASGQVRTVTLTAKAGKGRDKEPQQLDLFDCASELIPLATRSKVGILRTDRKVAAVTIPDRVTSTELESFVDAASSVIARKMKYPASKLVTSRTKEYRSLIGEMKKKEAAKPAPLINPADIKKPGERHLRALN